MKLKPKATLWEYTLSQPGAGGHQCTGSPHTLHPKIPAVIIPTEVLPASHPDFLWYFSCVVGRFLLSKQKQLSSPLLSSPHLKGAAVPQERSGKYEATMKVISGSFPCEELKLCYGKYAASVQQQPWQGYSFFPRNQVLYCYVTKVNNDSLNDPKKKN